MRPVLLRGFVALSTVLGSPSAFADDPLDTPTTEASAPAPKLRSGFALGLRAGYGRALSGSTQNSLTFGAPSVLPLILDAGYKSGHVYAGIYGQMALASRSDCPTGGCSAKDYQLGINVHYHFRPERGFDPWVGIGAGYETLHLSGLAGVSEATIDRKGIDFAILQLGADFQIGQDAAAMHPHVGPFFGLALGRMDTQRSTIAGNDSVSSSDTPWKGHQWLTIGVRGTLDL